MITEIQNHPEGRTLFIARSDSDRDDHGADDREVEFVLPPGTYIRSSTSISAHLGKQIAHCTIEMLEPDGKTWRKGMRAKLSGTVRVRMNDKGDSRELTIHTTLEDPREAEGESASA